LFIPVVDSDFAPVHFAIAQGGHAKALTESLAKVGGVWHAGPQPDLFDAKTRFLEKLGRRFESLFPNGLTGGDLEVLLEKAIEVGKTLVNLPGQGFR